jgi:subtilisin family serine protease
MFNWAKDVLDIAHKHRAKHALRLMRQRFVTKNVTINPQIKFLSANPNWTIDRFHVPEVWQVTKGDGIKVAILDTGIDVNHIDLRDAIGEVVDMTTERDPRDYNGHGTHVSGIVGARNKLGTGMTGVAPACTIYSVKVMDSRGSGNFDWIVNGLNWAIDKNVDIISMSLGCSAPYSRMYDAIKRAYDKGIILVAAAGNDGQMDAGDDMGYPARYDEVIAVGSVDANMSASYFSSVGQELDIMAPGGNIYSTFPGNRYAVLSGTSQATPFISGVSALILAKHRSVAHNTPISNGKDMLAHLKKAAIDIGAPGWDLKTGFGIIDPEKILTDN